MKKNWDHFLKKKCGAIENIRIIRDPVTHVGKGIAYVTFKEKEGFSNAIKENGKEFKNRELRIKKAVPSNRLEKKKKKVMNKLNAQRRLNNLDPDEIEEANNTKDEVLDRYIDNKELSGPNVDDVDYDNKTSVSPGLIRKKD